MPRRLQQPVPEMKSENLMTTISYRVYKAELGISRKLAGQ